MVTINYILNKPNKDGMRLVSFVVTYNRVRRRIPSNISVQQTEITKRGKITSPSVMRAIENIIARYRRMLYDMEIELMDKEVTTEWICARLTAKTDENDFFSFAEDWLARCTIKGKKNYQSMLNSLRRFVTSSTLPFIMIDYNLLSRYRDSLRSHPRAQSLYLGAIRHIYNEAVKELNSQLANVIPPSPFTSFVIPKHTPNTKDRVVDEATLVKIFRYSGVGRTGLARDCYILSFCLIGMNSVDLYECKDYKRGVISYDRAKTRDRRSDNAHIEVVVPSEVKPLVKKYKGTSRVFDFYNRYTNASNFNKHLNIGLKQLAKEIGVPPFDFYSARHTWASIARNRLGIDKYTIHEALNHVSELDITDIYIQSDFTNINKANEKVMEYISGLIKKEG